MRPLREPDVISTAHRRTIASKARPLAMPRDLDPLLERIGEARYVLLGEASHGTSEYYNWRTILSRRLIEEQGFSFLAVEGDWPDCYRVNRFVRGLAETDATSAEVLQGFNRWPTWMWCNEEVVILVDCLRKHNATAPPDRQVGFYGLDVYSLWDSLYRVMSHLYQSHRHLVASAQRAFGCFEPYGEDVQDYARATRWLDVSCEDEVVSMLTQLRSEGRPSPDEDAEAHFDAEQNAIVVKNAEHYYRTMVRGDRESWNIRDRHMADTLDNLMKHCGPKAKAIVWEHNTHIGDARFTDMARAGMVNVGQLAREAHGEDDVVLIGFASHHGDVIAAKAWDAPAERMVVPPARSGSWEHEIHEAVGRDALFLFDDEDRSDLFTTPRGQRAIGVVYHPEREWGNYVPTILPRRYDALIYLEETHALHPLPGPAPETHEEAPATFPSGV